MTRKQLAALGAVVLIALAAVGIGYGLWFEVLQLDGTVTTGTLDVTIDGEVHTECITVFVEGMEEPEEVCAGDPLYNLKTNYGELVHCEVSDTDVVLDNDNPDNVDTGSDLLEVAVFGAYPGYRCYVEFEVTNEGSVPIHFTHPQLVSDPADPNFADFMEVAGCFEDGYINAPLQALDDTRVARPAEGSDATCDYTWQEVKAWMNSANAGLNGDSWSVDVSVDGDAPAGCEFRAGLATYEEYGNGGGENGLRPQWLFSYDETWLPAGGSDTLTAAMPVTSDGEACEAQVDWYVGPTLLALTGGNPYVYGSRKLGYNHSATENLQACDPHWQLHEGDSSTCVMVIGFTNDTVLDGTDIPIAENGAYQFLYEIPAWQWNEDDAAEDMFFSPLQ